MSFKVGQVAARTGLSVRTLHHYEEIGLLAPSGRSRAGHRLYQEDDITRLLHIRSLRQLGLGLEEIRQCLADPKLNTQTVIQRRLDAITAEITLAQRLRRRLESLLSSLQSRSTVDVEDVLQTLETMTMIDKYFTEEQQAKLEQRRQALGAEAIERAQTEWPQLIAAVQVEMDKGTDPTAPEVVALARRWQELLDMFSGGDPELLGSTKKMYMAEPEMMRKQGMSPEMFAYVGQAMAAL